MSLIKDIRVGMSVDQAPFTRGLKSAEAGLGRFNSAARQTQSTMAGLNFRSASSGILSVKTAVVGLGAALAVKGASDVVGSVVGGIGEAVAGASNLNEQISKSQVVFGKSASIIDARADEMARRFGYVKAEFYEGASSIGLIAKASGLAQPAAAAMGASFAKLAADAASFYNVPVDEALGAIRSGLVGEAEPMRRFGVLLNEDAVKMEAARMGLARLGAELTEGQKVQARGSLIAKGLADASGDLERTFNSAANLGRAAAGRWQNALADLGTAIQPVTDRFYGLRESALKMLTDELVKNQDAIRAWAENAVTADGIVGKSFDAVATGVGGVADSVQVLNVSLLLGQTAFVELASVGTKSLRGLGTVFDVTMAAMGYRIPQVVDASGVAFTQSLDKMADDMKVKLGEAAIAPWASEAIRKRFDAVKAAIPKVTPAGAGAGAVRAAEGAALPTKAEQKVSGDADKLVASLRTEIATFGMAGKASEIYALKLAGASKAQVDTATSLSKQLDLMEKAKALRESIRTPGEQLAKSTKELDEMRAGGFINATEHKRGLATAREGAGFSAVPKFAGAVTAGSTEAYSSQLRFAGRDAGRDEPMKATAKATEKSVDIQQQMLTGINKLVDKGLSAAGGAVAELFAF